MLLKLDIKVILNINKNHSSQNARNQLIVVLL